MSDAGDMADAVDGWLIGSLLGLSDYDGANNAVSAAEARGAPATYVSGWRQRIAADHESVDTAAVAEDLALIKEEASGWSAAGNAGVSTTRTSDDIDHGVSVIKKEVADDIAAGKKALGDAADKVESGSKVLAVVVVALLALFVVLKARA